MSRINFEKIFWLLVIGWFVLRSILLWCQFTGNTDPSAKTEALKYFTEAQIEEGKTYAHWGFTFKAIFGFLQMAAIIALLRFGVWQRLYNFLDKAVTHKYMLHEIMFGLAFLLALRLLALPASYYLGFLREKAAGFAAYSFFSWLVLFLKSALVGAVIDGTVIFIIFAVINWFPAAWHIVLPAALGVVGFVGMFLFPLIVTPIFYNMEPMETGELKTRLLETASKGGVEVSEIYIIDESRYSTHTNAYFTGIGPFKRIVLYDNLLKKHTPEEVTMIFAHESGHWHYNHMMKGLLLTVLGIFAASLLYKYIFPGLAAVKWFGLTAPGSASSLPFLLLMFSLITMFTAPIESNISRYMETQADAYSLEMTGLKEAYISTQTKLALLNKSDVLPHPFRVWWLYSHPEPLKRLGAAGK